MRVIASGRRCGAVSRLLVVGLILVVIVMIAGWFAVRSDGGRDLIETHLSKRLGAKVSVGRSRIGWPYVLVLEEVRTPGFEAAGTPGFSIEELRLGRRLRHWRLQLRQAIARVQEGGNARWEPACLSRLADLRDAGARDVVRLTEGVRDSMRIELTNCSLSWLDADGNETASVRNVDFSVLPVRIRKRRLHYFELDIYQGIGVALAPGRDVHREWLTTQEMEYIELSGADASGDDCEPPADVPADEDEGPSVDEGGA
jgi:hypothetical protein